MRVQSNLLEIRYFMLVRNILKLIIILFERVLSQDVELQKIHTNEQVADIFTKALVKLKFEVFRKALGVIEK